MGRRRSRPANRPPRDGRAQAVVREPVRQEPAPTERRHDGHGHDQEELRPGWSRPKPEHVPRPTYWPAVLAFGITFLFWGLISTPIIAAIGLAIGAIGLAGWIAELRHDH